MNIKLAILHHMNIYSIQKFANDLRSKKYLFEEVGTINSPDQSLVCLGNLVLLCLAALTWDKCREQMTYPAEHG
ncbi:hypothetical protein Zm00014a_026436 [Zea mays]|uniref:Uncharacterized protein n=1 Tax=Zea mays TaxID=4577 RepID=A0A3L6FHJ7_MAIZE|nr:hypothetical protein Zm00014a_026436 [Zea mays]